jgi:hypothetical protein
MNFSYCLCCSEFEILTGRDMGEIFCKRQCLVLYKSETLKKCKKNNWRRRK